MIPPISALPHTWLVDLDGTIVKHNGHFHGAEKLLPGVREFWEKIPDHDVIVILSARKLSEQELALAFLSEQGLRVDRAIFGLPSGERVLINDIKPSGLLCAHAVNVPRDTGLRACPFAIDEAL